MHPVSLLSWHVSRGKLFRKTCTLYPSRAALLNPSVAREFFIFLLINMNSHTTIWAHTPEHGSWLNMAKCELSILTKQGCIVVLPPCRIFVGNRKTGAILATQSLKESIGNSEPRMRGLNASPYIHNFSVGEVVVTRAIRVLYPAGHGFKFCPPVQASPLFNNNIKRPRRCPPRPIYCYHNASLYLHSVATWCHVIMVYVCDDMQIKTSSSL